MKNNKRLPVGIQTFSTIIEEDYLYIDKTAIALDLIENYHYVFLSRPRRFGKSLFLSTLEEIFKGNKKLFKGLAIADQWDFKNTYPVIIIDFAGDFRNPKSLVNNLMHSLERNQEKLGVPCKETQQFDNCFSDLIIHTYEKYQQKVVVLIDEYDKAIVDNLDQIEVAKENREILHAFYSILKSLDRYIEFVFITGVSKFSRASIFSGLNMLEDISLNPRFGNICGYTQNDIETTFKPYLEGVDLKRVKQWYNGYNFLKDKVYNPFDILLFIKNDYLFKNYWFNTGTPTFLIKLFKQGNYNLATFENLEVPEKFLENFDLDEIGLETIMFQSGYLTIKSIEQQRNRLKYTLTYPNLETKMSLNDYLIGYFVKSSHLINKVEDKLIESMENNDFEKLRQSIESLFASIAYNNFTKNDIQNYEGFYASVIYAYFAGAGFDKIIAEDATNKGRIDLSVFIDDKVFIFEFKVDSKGALKQIKKNNYQQKYLADYHEIYLIGVEFDSTQRNVMGFEWERVC
ncbi:MAG: FIG00914433: hypothetical protein [uncultured Sulfurovum sp.]|uniref:AAA-ATPase-like domain-containing protein n=1 Tax=uncultured Sulfurovum sp. TaxID=269237 RepID=A0A6S6U1V7_9BACT|nr:MAG: FIG00914433: hypothetical protein [uncultured Sulfurovum sp.]